MSVIQLQERHHSTQYLKTTYENSIYDIIITLNSNFDLSFFIWKNAYFDFKYSINIIAYLPHNILYDLKVQELILFKVLGYNGLVDNKFFVCLISPSHITKDSNIILFFECVIENIENDENKININLFSNVGFSSKIVLHDLIIYDEKIWLTGLNLENNSPICLYHEFFNDNIEDIKWMDILLPFNILICPSQQNINQFTFEQIQAIIFSPYLFCNSDLFNSIQEIVNFPKSNDSYLPDKHYMLEMLNNFINELSIKDINQLYYQIYMKCFENQLQQIKFSFYVLNDETDIISCSLILLTLQGNESSPSFFLELNESKEDFSVKDTIQKLMDKVNPKFNVDLIAQNFYNILYPLTSQIIEMTNQNNIREIIFQYVQNLFNNPQSSQNFKLNCENVFSKDAENILLNVKKICEIFHNSAEGEVLEEHLHNFLISSSFADYLSATFYYYISHKLKDVFLPAMFIISSLQEWLKSSSTKQTNQVTKLEEVLENRLEHLIGQLSIIITSLFFMAWLSSISFKSPERMNRKISDKLIHQLNIISIPKFDLKEDDSKEVSLLSKMICMGFIKIKKPSVQNINIILNQIKHKLYPNLVNVSINALNINEMDRFCINCRDILVLLLQRSQFNNMITFLNFLIYILDLNFAIIGDDHDEALNTFCSDSIKSKLYLFYGLALLNKADATSMQQCHEKYIVEAMNKFDFSYNFLISSIKQSLLIKHEVSKWDYFAFFLNFWNNIGIYEHFIVNSDDFFTDYFAFIQASGEMMENLIKYNFFVKIIKIYTNTSIPALYMKASLKRLFEMCESTFFEIKNYENVIFVANIESNREYTNGVYSNITSHLVNLKFKCLLDVCDYDTVFSTILDISEEAKQIDFLRVFLKTLYVKGEWDLIIDRNYAQLYPHASKILIQFLSTTHDFLNNVDENPYNLLYVFYMANEDIASAASIMLELAMNCRHNVISLADKIKDFAKYSQLEESKENYLKTRRHIINTTQILTKSLMITLTCLKGVEQRNTIPLITFNTSLQIFPQHVAFKTQKLKDTFNLIENSNKDFSSIKGNAIISLTNIQLNYILLTSCLKLEFYFSKIDFTKFDDMNQLLIIIINIIKSPSLFTTCSKYRDIEICKVEEDEIVNLCSLMVSFGLFEDAHFMLEKLICLYASYLTNDKLINEMIKIIFGSLTKVCCLIQINNTILYNWNWLQQQRYDNEDIILDTTAWRKSWIILKYFMEQISSITFSHNFNHQVRNIISENILAMNLPLPSWLIHLYEDNENSFGYLIRLYMMYERYESALDRAKSITKSVLPIQIFILSNLLRNKHQDSSLFDKKLYDTIIFRKD